MSQTGCPKCGKPKIQATSCAFCGIVFDRFQANRAPKPKDKAKIKRRIGPLGLRLMGDYARLFRQLARMLHAGCSLLEGLQTVKSTSNRISDRIQKVADAIDEGHHLVESFAIAKTTFPSFVWGHLEAGERSGHLVELLQQLADELEARRKWILKQVFNFRTLWLIAMLVFAAISLSITESVRHLTIEVVDQGQAAILTTIFKGSIGRFTLYGTLMGTIVFAFAWFQIIGKHRLTQRYSWMEHARLNLPFFSNITRLEVWRRYLRLLSKMLESGLPLQTSLRLAQQDVEFPSWKKHFDVIQQTLDQGGALSDGFRKLPFVPPRLVTEMRVAEKTGTLSESLARDSEAMAEEIKRFQNVVQIVFLISTIILGIILALFVILRGFGAWIPIYEKVLTG